MSKQLIKGISHIKIQSQKGKDGVDGQDGKDAVLPPTIDLRVPGVELITLKGERGEKGVQGETGPVGKDGKNGKDGNNGKDGKDGSDGQNGSDGKNGVDGSPDTPEQVTEKINASSKKIDSKQVKGLQEVISEVAKIGTNPIGGGGGKTVRYLDDGIETSAHVTELNFGTNIALTYDGNGRLTASVTGGAGDVSKVGTPVNNQVGVWTGNGTLEGDVDLTFDTTTNTLATSIVTVTDDAYGAGWNGSLQVPTKNALYDKIETLGGGSGITRSISNIAINTTAGATASTDYEYNCTAALTLTLPTAVGNTNKYTVTRIAGLTTVATTAAQTINGSPTATLTINNMSLDFVSDNANWNVK